MKLKILRQKWLRWAAKILADNGYWTTPVQYMRNIIPPEIPILIDYTRIGTLFLLADEIKRSNVQGNVAELGVYQGNFASYINQAFPDKKFYLFDTFEGFAREQAQSYERRYRCKADDFSNTSVDEVLKRIGFPNNCIIKKGYFPETACDIDDIFCFVSLDADLYEPTLDGLRFFYPRLAKGGYILVHDYGSARYPGCGEAVRLFCSSEKISYVPICDRAISAVIVKS